MMRVTCIILNVIHYVRASNILPSDKILMLQSYYWKTMASLTYHVRHYYISCFP